MAESVSKACDALSPNCHFCNKDRSAWQKGVSVFLYQLVVSADLLTTVVLVLQIHQISSAKHGISPSETRLLTVEQII